MFLCFSSSLGRLRWHRPGTSQPQMAQAGYFSASAGQPPRHCQMSPYLFIRFASIASRTFCAVHLNPLACLLRAYSRGHLRARRLLQLVTGALVSRLAVTYARSATASSDSSGGPYLNGFRRSFRRLA